MNIDNLKPGDTHEITIGNQKLYVVPIPWGRLKKLLAEIVSAMEQFSSLDTQTPAKVAQAVSGIVDEGYARLLPLIFPKDIYPFISPEWVENNVTLPIAKEVFLSTIKVNGLEDFLQPKVVAAPRVPVEERPLQETANPTT